MLPTSFLPSSFKMLPSHHIRRVSSQRLCTAHRDAHQLLSPYCMLGALNFGGQSKAVPKRLDLRRRDILDLLGGLNAVHTQANGLEYPLPQTVLFRAAEAHRQTCAHSAGGPLVRAETAGSTTARGDKEVSKTERGDPLTSHRSSGAGDRRCRRARRAVVSAAALTSAIRARCPAAPMNEERQVGRGLEVDNHVDGGQIQSPRGDIRAQQNSPLCLPEPEFGVSRQGAEPKNPEKNRQNRLRRRDAPQERLFFWATRETQREGRCRAAASPSDTKWISGVLALLHPWTPHRATFSTDTPFHPLEPLLLLEVRV